MRTTLYIGNWRLDQFADENVSVVSSVLDISDITKNTGDYTKTFTVPASKRNNTLFKHWYDANIDGGFDARIKVEGHIVLDGIPFKIGKFRLSKVIVKKNKPYSYTINFFGNLVSLKDTIGKDELSILNLSAYDHDYNSANVKLGLTSGLFSGDLIYTLMAKKRYYYNNNAIDNVNTDKIANIAWGGGSNTGVIWNELRASLRLIKIIEAIEAEYTVTNGYGNDVIFSRDFLGTSEFINLFMWLNPDKDKLIGGDSQMIDWDSGGITWMNLITNIGSYFVFNSTASNDQERFRLQLKIIPSVGYENIEYRIIWKDGEDEYLNETNTGTYIRDVFLSGPDYTYEMSFYIVTQQEFKYTAELYQQNYGSGVAGSPVFETSFASEKTVLSMFLINEELPKLKIMDFLKGIFNLFKLVVIPQDDGTLYIDTLKSFYSQGNSYDITKYTDFSSYEVERGVILNDIEMKFQEPTTILAKQFEDNTGKAYGDVEIRLKDENDKLLDGTSLKFTVPFEQFVYERITDQNDNNLTNIQLATITDFEGEKVNPKPHLHYNLYTNQTTKTFAFIQDDLTRVEINGLINTPFHHYEINNPNDSILFNKEFSTWDGVAIENSLYKKHYSDYVSAIFNVKKRSYKYKANLPIHIITKLQLNDILKIKEDYYRIDKYSYNLLTGKTDLNLITAYLTDFIDGNRNIYTDFQAKSIFYNIPNLDSYTITKIDQGFGILWVNTKILNNSLEIVISEFSTILGNERDMFITLVGNDTITIYINQKDKE